MQKYRSMGQSQTWHRSPKTKGKKRLRRLLKRMLIVCVMLGLLAALVFTGVHMLRWIWPTKDEGVTVMVAQAAVWGGQHGAKAMVIGSEIVTIAAYNGVYNVVVEPFTFVEKHQMVAEIVAVNQLAEIDKAIAEIDEKLDFYHTSRTVEAQLTVEQRQEAEADLHNKITLYAQSITSLNLVQPGIAHERMVVAGERYLALRLQEMRVNQSQEALLQQRQILSQEKMHTKQQLYAPKQGYFIPWGESSLMQHQSLNLHQLDVTHFQEGNGLQEVTTGSTVEQGDLLFTIVGDEDWKIFIQLSREQFQDIADARTVELVWKDVVLEGEMTDYVIHDDRVCLEWRMSGKPILEARLVDINLNFNSQRGIEVPVTAIKYQDEIAFVFLEDEHGIKQKPVDILAIKGDKALIDGITEGVLVIVDGAIRGD